MSGKLSISATFNRRRVEHLTNPGAAMALTLYYHPLSSYCHKVLIALYENGVHFERRLINLGEPADRAELSALWPLIKFPVLKDDERDVVLPESSIIIEHVDRRYPSTHPLLPLDADAALQVRLWDRIVDSHVHSPLQRIVGDKITNARANMDSLRETIGTTYTILDRQLTGRDWLAGDHFTLADCAASPALFYASTLQAFPSDCKRLAGYFERLVARPSVLRTLEEAKPWFHLYPFEEALPARFR
jgi:glutathione S-transferase